MLATSCLFNTGLCSATVSYTHLDVYKRQLQYSPTKQKAIIQFNCTLYQYYWLKVVRLTLFKISHGIQIWSTKLYPKLPFPLLRISWLQSFQMFWVLNYFLILAFLNKNCHLNLNSLQKPSITYIQEQAPIYTRGGS